MPIRIRSQRMETTRTTSLSEILDRRQDAILNDWMTLQTTTITRRGDLISEGDLRRHSQEFLAAFRQALASRTDDVTASPWDPVRVLLAEISRSRARQGFTPSETAAFVFSLKQPLFRATESACEDSASLVENLWTITVL